MHIKNIEMKSLKRPEEKMKKNFSCVFFQGNQNRTQPEKINMSGRFRLVKSFI